MQIRSWAAWQPIQLTQPPRSVACAGIAIALAESRALFSLRTQPFPTPPAGVRRRPRLRPPVQNCSGCAAACTARRPVHSVARTEEKGCIRTPTKKVLSVERFYGSSNGMWPKRVRVRRRIAAAHPCRLPYGVLSIGCTRFDSTVAFHPNGRAYRSKASTRRGVSSLQSLAKIRRRAWKNFPIAFSMVRSLDALTFCDSYAIRDGHDCVSLRASVSFNRTGRAPRRPRKE